MEKPEIYLPIIINLILAIITALYLREAYKSRKIMNSQLKLSTQQLELSTKQITDSAKQHAESTSPFIYVKKITKDEETENFHIDVRNETNSLARDIRIFYYDHDRDFMFYPGKARVTLQGNTEFSATASLSEKFSNKNAFMSTYAEFYGLSKDKIESIFSTIGKSFVLLIYTDKEGRCYAVKAAFRRQTEGRLARQRSVFSSLS